MTALDQAFIKAFSQQGTSPALLSRRAAAPAPEPRPTPVLPTKPVIPNNEAAPLPISDVFRDMLATLQPTPAAPTLSIKDEPLAAPVSSIKERPLAAPVSSIKEKPLAAPVGLVREKPLAAPTRPTKTEAPPDAFSWRSQEEAVTGAWATDGWQSSLDSPGSLCLAEPICIAEPLCIAEPVSPSHVADVVPSLVPPKATDAAKPVNLANLVAAAVDSPAAVAVECPVAPIVEPSASNASPSPVAPLSTFHPSEASPAPTGFKPAWQVDRFTWPRVCRRLMAKANNEFDRLADALIVANGRGQKVLAMTGCCRGEGATTLLLCAARRLAERGVKLVLVDADLARPRIAKRLGVQPQVGWNETCEEEGTPLDQAIVEATSNGLTLSTVNDPVSPSGHTTGDWSRLAPCLDELKEHYEMILVDLGPLENIESIGDALNRTVAGKIDAVLIVHNGRVTSAERLSDVEQTLTASGVPLAGMIENFVAV